MQIDTDHPVCPACGGRVTLVPLLHHMICAYVGPSYDFTEAGENYVCPKCRREIVSGTSEIVGTSGRCERCYREMAVKPARPPASGGG
jgi:DNA-directed RNA polymerase subunit RPC12/RpoP